MHAGSVVDDQEHDRERPHYDAGDGHPLVGGTPLVRRLHPQDPQDNRRDTGEDRATDQTGDPQSKSPAAQRVLLIRPGAVAAGTVTSGTVAAGTVTSGTIASGLLVVGAAIGAVAAGLLIV